MNCMLALIGSFGGWEILLIVLILLIFFGAKRIPALARGFGKGIREFKDATKDSKETDRKNEDEENKIKEQ